jgi:hypothetical protein
VFEGRQLDDDAVGRARQVLVGERQDSGGGSGSYEAWSAALEVVCAASTVQPA